MKVEPPKAAHNRSKDVMSPLPQKYKKYTPLVIEGDIVGVMLYDRYGKVAKSVVPNRGIVFDFWT